MRDEGYGRDYRYPHDYPNHIVAQNYWPTDVFPQSFYVPTNHGVEKTITERIEWWKKRLNDD